jgi:hypothetical protein
MREKVKAPVKRALTFELLLLFVVIKKVDYGNEQHNRNQNDQDQKRPE